ncbi:MAG: fumarylacetoacetate hydrolase family protein [Woeseiaceae bacterium]|nr:fumarylacetoacetate hydrolase family protein [Woeseiaceae bacterium]
MSEQDVFSIAWPRVDVVGGGRFPVHRIYCIGQNYAAHAREMGNDPDREQPVWFTKVADAVVPATAAGTATTVAYPPRTRNLHHEIELVVALSGGGRDLTPAEARDTVFGYAVGIDLTRRDLQSEARKAGRPWDTAKSFEQAAPLSAIRPVAEVGHPEAGRIWLSVNGELRQEGDIADLIWRVPEALAELSTLFTLSPGDLLFTGTPAGVGAVRPGDRLAGGIDGIGDRRHRRRLNSRLTLPARGMYGPSIVSEFTRVPRRPRRLPARQRSPPRPMRSSTR